MAGRRKKTEETPGLAAESALDADPVALPAPDPAARPESGTAAELSTQDDSGVTEPARPAEAEAPAPLVPEPEPQAGPAPDAAPGPEAPAAAEPAPEPSPEPERAAEPDPERAAAPAPEPEPERAAPPAPPVAPPPARANPLLPVLGGVVAAFAGFVLAQAVPQGWPLAATTQAIAGLEQRLAAQDRKLAELTAPVVDAGLADRLAAVEARLESLAAAPPAPDPAGVDPAELAALRAEIEALRQAVPAVPDIGPLQAELAALRAELAAIPRESGVAQELEAMKAAAEAERAAAEARAEAMRAEADTLRAEAEATARAAVARGAILRVQAALEAGGSYEAALADLGAAGLAVPAALADHAAGLPTLAELQAGFPDAARAALAATVRPAEGAPLADRLGSFLKAQTGLRSTAPREGDDPDAVLSRAEAALRAGDLPATLAELDKLPPEAAPALAEWRALADTRAAAAAALAALAADLDAK